MIKNRLVTTKQKRKIQRLLDCAGVSFDEFVNINNMSELMKQNELLQKEVEELKKLVESNTKAVVENTKEVRIFFDKVEHDFIFGNDGDDDYED